MVIYYYYEDIRATDRLENLVMAAELRMKIIKNGDAYKCAHFCDFSHSLLFTEQENDYRLLNKVA